MASNALFLDAMFGTPLALYIDKDVPDRPALVDLVNKHGGSVSQGYSAVPYILVNPHKRSGQNLYRQYANKKGKIVLDARWIRECIKSAQLHTFASNWAGCKLDGSEAQIEETPPPRTRTRHVEQQQPQQPQEQQQPQQQQAQSLHIDPQTQYAFQVYVPPIQLPSPTPPPPWQHTAAIAPEQTHLLRPADYREDTTAWNHYHQPASAPVNPAPAQYDYTRYRDDENGWTSGATYYEPAYTQPYQSTSYVEEDHTTPEAGPSTLPPETPEKPRGRKRARAEPTAGTSPSSLVVPNRNASARSPTPPTRVVKSTYGGNLFTADDIMYLKKYIDYCHEQGMVLSLREICERIAVKAPHHTFYSWRRYCNKHQIRLGGYTMNADNSSSPNADCDDDEENPAVPPVPSARPAGGSIHHLMHLDVPPRDRSPTPPRALFRSTTGKGVAFTDADIKFLIRFMEYRKSQGKLDMVQFWKDVASKAPHHSRASWMKFWRRHKHELERSETDAPLPQPPDKKMRYSRGDDILLAKHFVNKVEGKSDQIFQAFGRMYPHHPWKGWQEHHRIHKGKIDNYISRLANGETLEDELEDNLPE
ncbi:hypothetical protein DFH06DRAFT_1162490 [Mycena polygramma]|nr:hypothetical protein DFH06DRAFT_1162490 [Mycena polygramma]